MAITVSWVNLNGSAITTKIYRSDNPFTPETAPAEPVATIEDGSVTWVDESVGFMQEKYYMLKFERDGVSRVSSVQKFTGGYNSPLAWTPVPTVPIGNHFEYLGIYNPGTMPDGFLTHVAALLGAAPTAFTNFFVYRLGGRTFFFPELTPSVNLKTMQENGLLFGGRDPMLPEGMTKDDFGGDRPFVFRGHRFACGFPKHVPPEFGRVNTFNVLDLKNSAGQVTYEQLARSETVLLATQFTGGFRNYQVPRDMTVSNTANTAISSRYLVSCDALTLAATGEPNLLRLSNISASTFATTVGTIAGGTVTQATPIFEYLGA